MVLSLNSRLKPALPTAPCHAHCRAWPAVNTGNVLKVSTVPNLYPGLSVTVRWTLGDGNVVKDVSTSVTPKDCVYITPKDCVYITLEDCVHITPKVLHHKMLVVRICYI